MSYLLYARGIFRLSVCVIFNCIITDQAVLLHISLKLKFKLSQVNQSES